jgi:peptide methionine sulfoxide reductase msrA/msrB
MESAKRVGLLGWLVPATAITFACVRSPAPEGAAGGTTSSESPARKGTAMTEAVTRPNTSEGTVAGARLETALLAGGCFWGMQEILRAIPGVVSTEVGYTGGQTANPDYSEVKTGRTGHAEAVRIVFDPAKLSYSELLEKWFFRMHDPTTKNRQGNDVGTQYRSAIWVASPEQRKVAEAVIRRVNDSGKWHAPVVTEIADAGPFTRGEDYHQDYLQKHPGGYTCHWMRE